MRPRRALARVLILSAHEGWHVWQADLLYVLLHVLVNLIVIEVLKFTIVKPRTHLRCIVFFLNFIAYKQIILALPLLLHRCLDVFETVFPFSLHFHNFYLLLVVVVNVKYIYDAIGTTHKVGMVCVDVGILDPDQVLDHCVCGLELIV